ncbi:uridine kinase [bacterium]|nr:uridine kinase [bacterium]
MNSSFIVGLSGGSASGKTSFIHALRKEFSAEELCVISLDHYYKPLSAQIRDENGEVNFDHPDGIDFARVKRDLRLLLKGKTVKIVEYTFNNPALFPQQLTFRPTPIILIEGLYVFADAGLRKMLDWRLFLEVHQDEAFRRRLERDLEERGMTEEEVHYQWKNHVIPSHKEHLQPHLKDVHLFIDNNRDFREGLEQVCLKFREILNS